MISTATLNQVETDLTPEQFGRVAEFYLATDLDPKEIHDLAEWVLSDRKRKAADPEAKQKPKPKETKVKTEDVETFVPWDFRLNTWLLNNFGLGSRDGVYTARGDTLWLPRKLLVWGILAYPRVRRMLWVVRSGKVKDDAYWERIHICNKCPSLRVDKKSKPRCGSCGCPDWHYSDLVIKNGLRANHCPEKRHAGDYIKLVTHKAPNRKAAKPKSSGCGAHTGALTIRGG
ncbi:MAG: hypothetical protein O7D91_17490 [Planctomycetota bacterium]|nr:hypothetical protein [Planctomycetota bacterium]